MTTIPATDLVHAGADGLTREVAVEIENAMLDRIRQPAPFIPDVTPEAKLLIDQQAARELADQRKVEAYELHDGSPHPQSYAEFQLERQRAAVAPAPVTKPAKPEAFDAAKAARRILDDLGSPMWDLHDKQ